MEKRLQTTGAIGLSVNSGRRDKELTKTIDPVLGERTVLPVLDSGEAAPRVLYSVLGPSLQERY